MVTLFGAFLVVRIPSFGLLITLIILFSLRYYGKWIEENTHRLAAKVNIEPSVTVDTPPIQ